MILGDSPLSHVLRVVSPSVERRDDAYATRALREWVWESVTPRVLGASDSDNCWARIKDEGRRSFRAFE